MDESPSRTAGARILLLNYSGYPDYTSYFLADNGLAYLAGTLIADGHQVQIHDCVTLDMAERLFHPIVREKVPGLRAQVRAEVLAEGRPRTATLDEATEVDAEIDRLNRATALTLADELITRITIDQIDVLAVKLWSQPSIHDLHAILSVVRRALPRLRIILGGGHVDYFLDRVMTHFEMADAAAYADGELGFRGFAAWVAGSIDRLDDVPNLLFRRDGEVHRNGHFESDQLAYRDAFPNYDADVYPAAAAPDQKMLTIPFEDSRGCQYKCGFCIHPIKSGGLRIRKSENVLDELEYLNRRHGFINFTGGGSNTPFSHAVALYGGMQDRGLDLAVNFFQSLRDFRINKAQAMTSAHIPLLWIGVETAQQNLLEQTYDKRRDMEKTKQVCEFLNEHKIGYIMSLIYPSPGESESSRQATIDFVQDVGLGHIVVYPPLLQPRTPWMHHPDVTWLDKQLYLHETQGGLEELENRVLPPMVRSAAINESMLMNGKTYREIYYQNLLFRQHLDTVSGGERGYKRKFFFTDELAPFMTQLNETFGDVDECLESGDFDRARASMSRFNEMATAGSVRATRLIAESRGSLVADGRLPKVAIRTGGPA
ncbi:MAG TPA: radical SAM protein [Kineosporiaceae bacterium]|nr:radical SAM protein [Kineosporiaceae bacterium]